MKDIFEIRDYTKDKRGRLIWISCLICNRDFQIPYIHRKAIKTCCKYCQELKISWAKTKVNIDYVKFVISLFGVNLVKLMNIAQSNVKIWP